MLFHGLTNSPAQYSAFAPMLFERGVNVLVPRMPEHGNRDRMTTRIAEVTPEALLSTANEAVDIACGLGERTGVLGISMGALLAGYCAQFRRLDEAVLIAPNFGLLHLPRFACRLLSWGLRAFPNRFMWWDPRVRDTRGPLAAYPRFPTRVLGATMSIADAVYECRAKAAAAYPAHRHDRQSQRSRGEQRRYRASCGELATLERAGRELRRARESPAPSRHRRSGAAAGTDRSRLSALSRGTRRLALDVIAQFGPEL